MLVATLHDFCIQWSSGKVLVGMLGISGNGATRSGLPGLVSISLQRSTDWRSCDGLRLPWPPR